MEGECLNVYLVLLPNFADAASVSQTESTEGGRATVGVWSECVRLVRRGVSVERGHCKVNMNRVDPKAVCTFFSPTNSSLLIPDPETSTPGDNGKQACFLCDLANCVSASGADETCCKVNGDETEGV
jgi:hypothetical protein